MINVLFVIAWRDLLAQLRSRSFLVQTLLLPFILTLLIGNAIGGTRKADPLPVAVVGTGEIAQSIGDLLEQSKIAKVFRLPDAPSAENAVRTGLATMAVILPERLEAKLLRNDKLGVRVLIDPTSHQRGEVVKQLVRGYMQQLEAARAAILGGVRAIAPASAGELQETLTLVRGKVQKQFESASIELQTKEASGRSQGIFAYYVWHSG